MPGQPFQLQRELVGLVQLRVFLQQRLDVGHGVAGLFQREALAELDRNELAHLVHLGVLQPHHAGHVLQAGLARHRSECGDHGHLVVAVLLAHVVDDFHAAGVVEVDVEVGHGNTVRVQEALEQQVEFQRVEVGDPDGVAHDGPRARPTPRPHADALVLGPVDVVGHDQQVIGKAHVVDHRKLVLGAAQQGQRVGVVGAADALLQAAGFQSYRGVARLALAALPVEAGVVGQLAFQRARLHHFQRRVFGVLLARRLALRLPLAAHEGDQRVQGVHVAGRRVAAVHPLQHELAAAPLQAVQAAYRVLA